MLAVLCGFHGLSPRHGFSCPAALLPVGSYSRLVVGPKDKVGKVTSGSHAYKSLLLKNAWPVLCHSVLWDPPCCCLIAPCHVLRCQSHCSRGPHWYCLAFCAEGTPWACGRIQANWDAMKQERGRGESSAELCMICHPRFQFKLLSQLSSNSDHLWLGCRIFAWHCVWHEGRTLLLLPFLVE